MFRPFVRRILKKADIVQSLGGRLTDILRKVGIPEERIMEIGIGIEESWVRESVAPPAEKRVFTFVGRYERRKGVEEFSSAILKLVGSGKMIFNFVGPVPPNKQIQSPDVHYHGMLDSGEAIMSVLDVSDFLVLPSYAEGMPTVILEAMARGCAIIASDVGAVNEQVSSANGILMREPSVDEVVKALEDASAMPPNQLSAMKAASLKIVSERFLWQPLVEKMIQRLR